MRVIRLCCSGVSFRKIGRLENVSPTSVRRLVRQYAQWLPEVGVNTPVVSMVELDEQWHFVKKVKSSGFGKRLIMESGNYWTGS